MTRDEVLERLDRMEAETNRQMVLMEGSGQWAIAASHRVDAEVFSAAAEIIRESGWRPIAKAPEKDGYFAKRIGQNWIRCYFLHKQNAVDFSYTHYLPEPAPPAREASDGPA